MAAIGCHIVNVGVFQVNPLTGVYVDKNDPATTIGQTMRTEMRHLVIPAADVPNSGSVVPSRTVKEYLKLEAADGYVLAHIDQTTIITYER